MTRPEASTVSSVELAAENRARVVADCVVDEREHHRRVRAGLGAIRGLTVLDALLTLPLGHPVPLADLSPGVRSDVRRAPTGAVERTARTVVRCAAPSLLVEHVLLESGRDWRAALRRANRFGQYAACSVALPQRPARLEDLLMEAAYRGVGVQVGFGGDEPQRLASPEPFVVGRFSAARWEFIENTYARLDF